MCKNCWNVYGIRRVRGGKWIYFAIKRLYYTKIKIVNFIQQWGKDFGELGIKYFYKYSYSTMLQHLPWPLFL